MAEENVQSLLNVRQAIAILDAVPVAARVVTIALDLCAGLRLAEDLRCDRDYPPFEKSLMDGYAVRCADVAGGQAELLVVEEIAAGRSPRHAIKPGQAAAIMTGAPVPPGADGIVPVEDVHIRAKVGENVRILRAPSPRRFIAAAGSDCRAGNLVLSRGTCMGPAQIAVAASVGAASLACFARPRVAILGTGDELVPVDQQPGPSQIRDSNTPMLAALLRRLGCEVVEVAHVPDQPDLIRDAITRGMARDVLFIAGGMSMGQYDYVPQLLIDLGVELKITKLRIKPGKPFLFGVASAEKTNHADASHSSPSPTSFIFGLPGNPVSAFVCTYRLASRLLARLGGGMPEERWVSGRLESGLPANGPREFYQPAVRNIVAGTHSAQAEFAHITPLEWKGSADVFTLAQANVLLARAENAPPIPKGTVLRVLELP